MMFLGVWACQWRELKPIAFGGGKSKTTTVDTGEDAETGFARENRGRGRDGAGAYEMVGMGGSNEAAP